METATAAPTASVWMDAKDLQEKADAVKALVDEFRPKVKEINEGRRALEERLSEKHDALQENMRGGRWSVDHGYMIMRHLRAWDRFLDLHPIRAVIRFISSLNTTIDSSSDGRIIVNDTWLERLRQYSDRDAWDGWLEGSETAARKHKMFTERCIEECDRALGLHTPVPASDPISAPVPAPTASTRDMWIIAMISCLALLAGAELLGLAKAKGFW